MVKRTRELISLLPTNLQESARGYMDYVDDVLYSVSLELQVYERRREIQSDIELIFFVKLLYAFFVTGYRNYDQSLNFLRQKGINGFEIGSTSFNGQSDISRAWRRIVTELEKIVDETRTNNQNNARYIRSFMPVETIIREIVQFSLRSGGN